MLLRVDRAADQLSEVGFVVLDGEHAVLEAAWRAALDVIASVVAKDPTPGSSPRLATLAEYTMPTRESPGRSFQVLHFDFGLPLALSELSDITRFTALFVDPGLPPSRAVTRLVRLADVAAQRDWPDAATLAERLRTRTSDPDTAEGVLARVIEEVDQVGGLPPKTTPGFLCGLEFDDIATEREYFLQHGIDLPSIEREVVLPPGGVLLFDNLACAHGRSGPRQPGELHQLCVGHRGVDPAGQWQILLNVLRLLTGQPS